jgi:tape measure domain-containing protein
MTADEVEVTLRARTRQYEADLERSRKTFDRTMGGTQQRIQMLEREIARSSGQISGHIRQLAAAFAGYFTGRELVGLMDNFTRLQNQLRVAGLEGQQLKSVQDQLFASAQRYGVSINALAELFGKATQAGVSLGATQAELLSLTDATAQALLITGTSTQAASGAILGLSQALAAGTVRAEEFNQMNEGGLAPLLQAAAAADRFGGDIGKLRAAVVDGTVSSREFYSAVLQNAQLLENQASKATLTLSAGFTTLTNALTTYFGEADKANGISAALGEALRMLAENLETIIPALATIGLALGVGYTKNALAARAATLTLRSSMGGLLAMLGGPVGLALTALTVGFGYIATEMASASVEGKRLREVSARNAAEFLGVGHAAEAASQQTAGLSREQVIARSAALGLSIDTNKLADAHYAAAAAARVQAIEEQRLAAATSAKLANRKASEMRYGAYSPLAETARSVFGRPAASFTRTQAEEFRNSPEYKAYILDLDILSAMQAAPVERFAAPGPGPRSAVPAETKKATKARKEAAARGKEADDITEQFIDELSRLQAEELSAQADASRNVFDRADLQRDLLVLEATDRRRMLERQIAAARADVEESEKMTAAEKVQALAFLDQQKAAQAEIIDNLYGVATEIAENGDIIVTPSKGLYPAEVLRELNEELAEQARDMLAREEDVLEAEAGIARTTAERYELERRALAIGQEIERQLLEQQIANGEIADADAARALLARRQAVQAEQLSRGQMSPFQRYRFDLENDVADLNSALEGLGVDVLDTVNDGLVDAIVNFRSLADVGLEALKELTAGLVKLAMQQIILRTLGGLFGLSGGGQVPGFASGGAIPSYAPGGRIRGKGGPRADQQLIRASPGEFMIQESAVRKLGTTTLDHINQTGRLPVFPTGVMIRAGAGRGVSPGLGPSYREDLRAAIAEAAATMPPINLYPTVDPAAALRSALNSPGGRRVMFDFMSQNSRGVRAAGG